MNFRSFLITILFLQTGYVCLSQDNVPDSGNGFAGAYKVSKNWEPPLLPTKN